MNRIIKKHKKIRRSFSPAQIIILVFAVLIVLGAGILCLPFASRSGQSCGFLTALFTACSSVCVTGLSLADTYTQWSGFGQAVILVMIQIGGLGFMTIFAMFLLMLREKIGIKKRMLLQQTYGLNDVQGVEKLLFRVVRVTAVSEASGAVILTLRFFRTYPFFKSLWMGVFHAVSAFCNAGFDILGFLSPGGSLSPFANDWIVCGTLMILITIGGIGFFVWEDLRNSRWRIGKTCIYTRLVLLISGILTVGGALLFGAMEWNNPATIGGMKTGDKILCALFQSVTTRTAGFASVSQSGLTEASRALSCIWMLIGGSSGSTAGGIKTVTAAVVVLSAIGTLRGKSKLTIMKRSVSGSQISLAAAIVSMMILLSLLGAIVITAADGADFLRALFETASALGTVGLTADLTPTLCVGSKLMLIVFMFFGRVGLATISTGLLLGNRSEELYQYAETKLLIG